MAMVKVNAKLDNYNLLNGEFEEGYVLTVSKDSLCGLDFKPLNYAGTGELVKVKASLTASFEHYSVENMPESYYKDGDVLVVFKSDETRYMNGINLVGKDDIETSDDLVVVKAYLDFGTTLNGKFKEGLILTVKAGTLTGLSWEPGTVEEPEEPVGP